MLIYVIDVMCAGCLCVVRGCHVDSLTGGGTGGGREADVFVGFYEFYKAVLVGFWEVVPVIGNVVLAACDVTAVPVLVNGPVAWVEWGSLVGELVVDF